jgi:hypothetical protein
MSKKSAEVKTLKFNYGAPLEAHIIPSKEGPATVTIVPEGTLNFTYSELEQFANALLSMMYLTNTPEVEKQRNAQKL